MAEPKPCHLKWVRIPKARCACGREFELDAYNATKPPRVQEDALLDAYIDHVESKQRTAD